MQQAIINGFRVMVFTGYDGTQLFINHPDGHNIYAHRVSGDPMERAKQIIALEMPEVITAPADKMICLSDRNEEFKAAMKRGLENDLTVEPDFERDTFLVVNHTNQTDYRVKLETRADGKIWGSCECRDFSFRRRICKHQSETLQDIFFGVTESLGVILN